MTNSDPKALVEGPPVPISRATIAVMTAIAFSLLGSGAVTTAVTPDDYVSRQELDLALERHTKLIESSARHHEDQAVERAIATVDTRLRSIEQLLREQRERTDKTLDDQERRLRVLESQRRNLPR